MSAPAVERIADVLGYRAHTRARSTGTTVILVDAYEQGLESPEMGGDRWFLICDEHAGCCGWSVQSDARSFMSVPEQWCPTCQEVTA